jgi:hypothetical protein
MISRKDFLSVSFLTLLNLLIRIPRYLSTAQGLDGFYVVWESELIFEGVYFSKGFDLGHLLGMHTFSGYPIGTLAVMCFFLLITNHHIMTSILLFDYFFIVIFIISLFFLSKKLRLGSKSTILFILLASTQPIVFQYSYFNSSARLPFFSIAPFALGFLIDWLSTKKHHKLVISIVITACLFFFHRISLMFIIVILLAIIIALYSFIKKNQEKRISESDFLTKVTQNKYSTYILKRKWLLMVIISYIISPFIFKDVFRGPVDFSQLITIENSFTKFIFRYVQMMANQWFRIGVPFLLSVLCIIVLLNPKLDDLMNKLNQKSELKFMLYLTTPFLILANNVYSYYFFFYAYALIPVILLDVFLTKKDQNRMKYYFLLISSCTVFAFILAYHFVIRSVGAYPIIAGCFLGLVVLSLFIIRFKDKLRFQKTKLLLSKRKAEIVVSLIMTTVILNSIFMMDRHAVFWNREDYLFSHISGEEIDLANFLLAEGFGVFDSFDDVLSTHVAVLSGWLFVQDMHSITVNYLNDNITTINDYNCSLRPFWQWYERDLITCDFRTGDLHYTDIITNNYNDSFVIDILSAFQVKYFITAKNSSLVELWDGIIDSLFISTLMNSSIPIVHTTENFLVWNVSTLY